MSNVVPLEKVSAVAIEKLLLKGDLSSLTPPERLSYYKNLCQTVGLNPLTKPFEYLDLKGKQVLYATKGCTEQLRAIHNVSIESVDVKQVGDVYVVIAQAKKGDRKDSATGAVPIKGLAGEALANAFMKAETKAKRRVTLSICGLNMLDETEVDSIPDAKKAPAPAVKEAKQIEAPQDFAPSDDVPYSDDPELADYVIPIGKKYFGKRLSEVEPKNLSGYVAWLRTQKCDDKAMQFIGTAETYLASLE
jgi:hypothetical protein